LFGCYWWYGLTEVDKKFQLKLSKSQIYLYCKMKSKENRFWRKKVKKKAYSITTQISKVFGIFNDKKVKNIDIEYRLQSIFQLCDVKVMRYNMVYEEDRQQCMPYELFWAKFGRNLIKIWTNLGEIWAKVIKICWANLIRLGKIEILHSQKHSIYYGYDRKTA